MGTERADAVIVGAGLAGSAAARALAGRGRSVVLLEAFQPEHRRAAGRAGKDPVCRTGSGRQGSRPGGTGENRRQRESAGGYRA